MSALDTPTRAVRCARPKTRRWVDLVNKAREDEEQATRLRTELSLYLARADRLAENRKSRRAAFSGRPKSSRPVSTPVTSTFSKPETGTVVTPSKPSIVPSAIPKGVPEADVQIPEIPLPPTEDAVALLSTRDAEWVDRAAALRAIATAAQNVETSETVRSMLPAISSALGVQLGDLRSRVVVEASQAIVASKKLLAPEQASDIFAAACGGVAVKKAVMADARANAAIAALTGVTDMAVWDVVLTQLKKSPHERARAVCVECVINFVKEADIDVTDVARQALEEAALDKSQSVREAAKNLKTEFKGRFGETATNTLMARLSSSAQSRLATAAPASAASSKVLVREAKRATIGEKTGKKMSMRDMIRMRRLAMKRTADKEPESVAGDEQRAGTVNSAELRPEHGEDKGSDSSEAQQPLANVSNVKAAENVNAKKQTGPPHAKKRRAEELKRAKSSEEKENVSWLLKENMLS